jgi:hypothetical protein
MSANIKASTDGTQAIIGVGGVDQMTVSNAGVVTANSFVGLNSSSVTATGSTTARTLANRFADVANVKDFGAVGNGTDDDTIPVTNAYNSVSSGNGGILQLSKGKYKTTGTIVPNYIAPTLINPERPSVLGIFDGSNSNPDTLNKGPAIWVQKITKRDGSSNEEHNIGGILSEVKVNGSGETGPVETNSTWISVLGNGVLDGQNVGTSSAPDYDLGGNVIGVAGFARSNKPSDGIVTALWGYAQTPIMNDTEFDSWTNQFTTTSLEINLDIEHKDPGAKTLVAGKGTTVGIYMMNYQESSIQRNLSFGIAFNSNPLTGVPNTDPNIDNWNGYHTGILLDKIQTNGILFGQYFKNGSYGIRFPDTWLAQEPAAAIHLGNSKMQMGEYLGSSFNNNDLWHNNGGLFFKHNGVNSRILRNSNGSVNLGDDVFFNGGSSGLEKTLRVVGAANTANYIRINSSIIGNAPAIISEGTDTNIDIELRPKGTGRVLIGEFTSGPDASINGYITVKDSNGNSRKIATIA